MQFYTKLQKPYVLNIKHIVVFITIYFFFSCKKQAPFLSQIQGRQVLINDSIADSDSIDAFIKPYRKRIDQVLDSPLAYASKTLTKGDGRLNTSAGNLLADLVFEQAGPLFEQRTGKKVDFVLLNHGGIRSDISKGMVSARTAYEFMPFENYIVIAELNGKSVRDLVAFLVKSGRAHPISGMQIILNKDSTLNALNIQDRPFDENKTYYVATNNYLLTGSDQMGFFKSNQGVTETNYLLRNAIIDYFKKKDTITASPDDRYIQLN